MFRGSDHSASNLTFEHDVQLQEKGVMGRSLMTLMASGLGGFGLYTEIIGTSACINMFMDS